MRLVREPADAKTALNTLFLVVLCLSFAAAGAAQSAIESREVYRSEKAGSPISLVTALDAHGLLVYRRDNELFALDLNANADSAIFMRSPSLRLDQRLNPFITPDGRNFVFRDDEFFTVALHGFLQPCLLNEARDLQKYAFSADGSLFAAVSAGRGLVLRNTSNCASGRVLATPGNYVDVCFVEDSVAYLRDGKVWLQRLDTHGGPELVDEDAVRVFGMGNYLVLLRQQPSTGEYRLYSKPVDGSHEEIALTPEPYPAILDRFDYPFYSETGKKIAVAPDGVTVAIAAKHTLLVSTLDGSVPPRTIAGDVYFSSDPELRWSPDGNNLVARTQSSSHGRFIFFVAKGHGGIKTGTGLNGGVYFTDDGDWALFANEYDNYTGSYNLREFRFGTGLSNLPYLASSLIIPGTHAVAYVLDNTLHVADLDGRWGTQLSQPGLILSSGPLFSSDSGDAIYFSAKFDGQDWGLQSFDWVKGKVKRLTPDGMPVPGAVELLGEPLADGTIYFNADNGFGPRSLYAVRQGNPAEIGLVHPQPAATDAPGVQWSASGNDLYFCATPNEYGDSVAIYRSHLGQNSIPLFDAVPDLYQFLVSPDGNEALMTGSIDNSYSEEWCDPNEKSDDVNYSAQSGYDHCTTEVYSVFDNLLYHVSALGQPTLLTEVVSSTGARPRMELLSDLKANRLDVFRSAFRYTSPYGVAFLNGPRVVQLSNGVPFGYSRDYEYAFYFSFLNATNTLQISRLAIEEGAPLETVAEISAHSNTYLGYVPAAGVAILDGPTAGTILKIGLDPPSEPRTVTSLGRFLSAATPDGRYSYFVAADRESWLYSLPVLDDAPARRFHELALSHEASGFRFTDDNLHLTFLDSKRNTSCSPYGCSSYLVSASLCSAPIDGSGPAVVISGPNEYVAGYAIAPSSIAVAYLAMKSGSPTSMYVTPINGGTRIPVESEGAPSIPVWNGDRLFFVSSGAGGTTLREATLDNYPPVFTRQPNSPSSLAEGLDLKLTVEVDEPERVAFRWEFSRYIPGGSGNFAPLLENAVTIGANTPRLTLVPQDSRSDAARAGYYRCVATNTFGDAYSRVVEVSVPGFDLREGEQNGFHSADTDFDRTISLGELMRAIQLYNSRGFRCANLAGLTEDGYEPGAGSYTSCRAHDSDYTPQDWKIDLSEVMRLVQILNIGAYEYCPGAGTEDGFCT